LTIGDVGRILFHRIPEGEDLLPAIRKAAEAFEVRAGAAIVIGSVATAVLGYFREGQYSYLTFNGPLEIVSGSGNISISEKGDVIAHIHLAVSDENGRVLGGHLSEGTIVGVTAEVTLIEAKDLRLLRKKDEKTGLNLWHLS